MEHGPAPVSGEVEVTLLIGCARCHDAGHPNLTFKRLTYPVPDEGGDFTHWAPCPTNGEPILMRITGEYGSLKTRGG